MLVSVRRGAHVVGRMEVVYTNKKAIILFIYFVSDLAKCFRPSCINHPE